MELWSIKKLLSLHAVILWVSYDQKIYKALKSAVIACSKRCLYIYSTQSTTGFFTIRYGSIRSPYKTTWLWISKFSFFSSSLFFHFSSICTYFYFCAALAFSTCWSMFCTLTHIYKQDAEYATALIIKKKHSLTIQVRTQLAGHIQSPSP